MKKLIAAFLLISLCAGGVIFTAYGQDGPNQAPAAKKAANFEITRLVVATGVDNRNPVGIADTFPVSTPKVICFLDAKNIAADTEVTFVWIYNGKEVLKTNLMLKAGYRWRTRADKNLYNKAGDWEVEIRNAHGIVIDDIQFRVE